jgi:hypothetical protein
MMTMTMKRLKPEKCLLVLIPMKILYDTTVAFLCIYFKIFRDSSEANHWTAELYDNHRYYKTKSFSMMTTNDLKTGDKTASEKSCSIIYQKQPQII